MITKKQLNEIKKELIECQKPFFFFHDDVDGLCSFLQMYKFKGDGKWHMVKKTPQISEDFIRFVDDDCDKVFILDIAVVDQEFIDKIKKPVIWIDHHTPLRISKCKYFNPRIRHPDEYTPVSAICYEALKYDELIGAVGTIGDVGHAKFLKDFFKKNKKLVDGYKNILSILFKSKIGKIVRILNFNLKGKTRDIRKSVGIITRMNNISALLSPKSEEEAYVYERYKKINAEYEKILGECINECKRTRRNEIFVFFYREGEVTFGGDLATEIVYRVPGRKIYIIAREKNGRILCSLRSHSINLVKFLDDAFKEVDGYGGGHPVAAGCSIRKEDFGRFLELARMHKTFKHQ